MAYSIITISRQYGSGGRLIGGKLAEWFCIPLYDQELIALAAQSSHIQSRFFEQAEQEGWSGYLDPLNPGVPFELPLKDRMFLAQSAAVHTVAEKGPCIIVGRCADVVLEDNAALFKVFLFADLEVRKNRILSEYGEVPGKTEHHMLRTDQKRAAYDQHYTQKRWGAAENYHLSIDTGRTGIDGAVSAIEAAYCRQIAALQPLSI